MALDTIAAQSAQSLLNGIDYSALIGGPLEAAIKAQAMAAQSTWRFIQNVGLQKTPDGRVEAVNVTFIYQKDGKLVRLIVPILTIVPIPLIIIDEVNIEFKANINASSSETQSDSSSENIAAEASAEAKVGWGPFSLSAKFQASYSSKKDSAATKESRYSVEYTQDVRVHASQAGMPAGLATVLNILSNAATDAPIEGALAYSPRVGTLNLSDMSKSQPLTVSVIDGNARKPGNHAVTLRATNQSYKDAIVIRQLPLGNTLAPDENGDIAMKTSDNGEIGLAVLLNQDNIKDLPADGIVMLSFRSEIDGKERSADFGIKLSGGEVAIQISPASVSVVKGGSPETATVAITEKGQKVTGKEAEISFSDAYEGVSAKVGETGVKNTPQGFEIKNGEIELSGISADEKATPSDYFIVVKYAGMQQRLRISVQDQAQ